MRARKSITGPATEEESGYLIGEIADYPESLSPTRKPAPCTNAFELEDSLEDVCAGLVHLELCWPANQPSQWGVATYGYCLECGARIDPIRLSKRILVLCLGCQEATQRRILLSALHGS